MRAVWQLFGGILVIGACSNSGIAPEPRATGGARHSSAGAQNSGGTEQSAGAPNAGSGGTEPRGSGGADADAGATSGAVPGSRIKMRWYVGDDGSRQLAGAYDSEREESCTWQLASDGQVRCLPQITAWGRYWADSECSTEPLFASDCENAKYGGSSEQSCGTVTI